MTDQMPRTDVEVLDGGAVSFAPLTSTISMKPVVRGPETALETVIADDDGGFCAVWEAHPGIYPRVKDKRGSAMIILSGDATVSDADGTAHELHEGSILVLPYRWEGEWDIRRTIRKVYIYSWPTGEPDERPAKATSRAAVDYADRVFERVLSHSDHGASLPGIEAEVLTDGVDGVSAAFRLAPGRYEIADGTKWAYLYLQTGNSRFIASDGNTVEAAAGAVVAVPRGWRGTAEISERISGFVFFTSDKDPGSGPVGTLRVPGTVT